MRGDYSRSTFDPTKHYTAVLQQQGRVQLDSDWNEQQLLALRRDQTTTRDLVGPTGAPHVEPGFGVTATGSNLSIGQGHFYVDGILCIQEANTLITSQLDLPGFVLPTTDGVYLAYLEVWTRELSSAEQPDLREKALGGPDTATRLQTVAQVKLLPLPTTGAAATCDGPISEWTTLLAQKIPAPAAAGKMSAQTAPAGVTADPACILPPSAGFKGLENQLYRVEIHRSGDRSSARFKWSRENGSVTTPVSDVSGLVLTVENLGRDDNLAFGINQWVELSDDALDLADQHGSLFLTGDVNLSTRKITVTGGPLPNTASDRHRVLRRWEQGAAVGTPDGVALDSAPWITLENGIQVHFEPGIYKAGDFWLIPARSAISLETGTIEWPTASGIPIAVPSEGNDHHLARLGIFTRNAGTWAPLPAAPDCRKIFPPLTAITATDVSFDNTVCAFSPAALTVQAALDELCRTRHCACTILISPGDNVQAAFDQLGAAHDAMVCFQAGDYRVDASVNIIGKGNLRITGCGPATRIFSPKGEAILRFQNCPSVSVESLQVNGGRTDSAHIDGALTFLDCPSVSVRQCLVTTYGFGRLRTSGITVRNTEATAAGTEARIVGCNIRPGHLQAGILLINVGRSFVQDNIIRPSVRPANPELLNDLVYRARLRRSLLSNAVFGPLPPGNLTTNATVTLNGQTVSFHTAAALTTANRNVNSWQSSITNTPPAEINGPHALFRALDHKADRAILGAAVPGLVPAVRNFAQSVLAQDILVGLQAIVVGGTRADSVQIVNNTIDDFVQGIHIGLSRKEAVFGVPAATGRITIQGNTVNLLLASSATLERHGIFVGNFTSLEIHSNYVTARKMSVATPLHTEGIRVFGFAGPNLNIKDNHLDGFDVGIAFTTRFLPVPHLWIITHNFAAGASTGVQAFKKVNRVLTAIREQIKGIIDNVP